MKTLDITRVQDHGGVFKCQLKRNSIARESLKAVKEPRPAAPQSGFSAAGLTCISATLPEDLDRPDLLASPEQLRQRALARWRAEARPRGMTLDLLASPEQLQQRAFARWRAEARPRGMTPHAGKGAQKEGPEVARGSACKKQR